jgi:hypothetical protein
VNDFLGNFVYGSASQLDFFVTSRKDDLHSLVYLLVYLFRGKEFLGVPYYREHNPRAQLKMIKKAKISMSVNELCQGESACLREFAKEVFAYSFEEQPDYSKLEDILIDAIDGQDLEIDDFAETHALPKIDEYHTNNIKSKDL